MRCQMLSKKLQQSLLALESLWHRPDASWCGSTPYCVEVAAPAEGTLIDDVINRMAFVI